MGLVSTSVNIITRDSPKPVSLTRLYIFILIASVVSFTSTMSCGDDHLGFLIGTENHTFVEYHPRNIQAKFHFK